MNDPNSGATVAPARPHILLVEDNYAAGRGLTKLLEIQGYEVTAVADGASALAAFQAGPPPDFLLTDLQLPDFDGLEIARQARQLIPPPCVALITGWDLHPSPDDFDRWGIQWIFPKPLDVRDLIEKLEQASRAGRCDTAID